MNFKPLVALLLIFAPAISFAENKQDNDTDSRQDYFRYGLGFSELEIADAAVPDSDREKSTPMFRLGLGRQLENQLITDMDVILHTQLFPFFGEDAYSALEGRLTLGYRLRLGKFGFIPKLGLSALSLNVTEGEILSLPESKRSEDSIAPVASLTIEFEFNKQHALQFEWSRLDAEIGDIYTTTVGFRRGF